MEASDYLQEGDIGFKKPKTKKKRPSRRITEDSGIDLPNGDSKMDVDEKPRVSRSRNLDENFVDDDELQASLARARRAKTLKKPKVLTQEEIAKKRMLLTIKSMMFSKLIHGSYLVAEERVRASAGPENSTAEIKAEEDDGDLSGLVFDDTSEFVRAIQFNPVPVKTQPKEEARERSLETPTARPQEDTQMIEADEAVEELEAGELPVKEEDDDDDDEAMLHALEGAISAAEAADEKIKQEGADFAVGTSSEQTYGSGLAATLNILRQQGVLAASSDDQMERERIQRQRDVWLAEYRTRLALRELERARARGEKKDQAQREYENRLREQQEARETLDVFKDYKPDVNIVYHDEFGRELTPKEAWKALSHRFHGKTSGKLKTEKRLKKIAEEKKKEAMASGDTPLSMNRAFQMRQEKIGQAHFVLSVGSRG